MRIAGGSASVAGHHVHLVFDGPGAEQRPPVVRPRGRPLRTHEEHLGPLQRVRADPLAKADVVADNAPGLRAFQVEETGLPASREVLLLLHQADEVRLVVLRHELPLRVDHLRSVRVPLLRRCEHRTADEPDAVLSGQFAEKGRRLRSFGVGQLLRPRERVPRVPHLGHDDGSRQLRRNVERGHPVLDILAVPLFVADGNVKLQHTHSKFHPLPPRFRPGTPLTV